MKLEKFTVGEGSNQKEVMIMAEFHHFDPREARLNELEKLMKENEEVYLPLHEAYDKKWIEHMKQGVYYEDTPEGKKENNKLKRMAKEGLKISAEIRALKRELGIL